MSEGDTGASEEGDIPSEDARTIAGVSSFFLSIAIDAVAVFEEELFFVDVEEEEEEEEGAGLAF